MPAPKGNQYAKGHGFGCPVTWTDELIEIEAKELVKWCKVEDNYFMKTFAVYRDYLPDNFTYWAKRSKVFAKALKQAHSLLEGRLVKQGLSSKTNPGFTKWVLACNYKWKEPPQEVINVSAKPGAEQYLEDMKKKETVDAAGDES